MAVPPVTTTNAEVEHRVGDALASRNVHSAVLDSLRLCVVF